MNDIQIQAKKRLEERIQGLVTKSKTMTLGPEERIQLKALRNTMRSRYGIVQVEGDQHDINN